MPPWTDRVLRHSLAASRRALACSCRWPLHNLTAAFAGVGLVLLRLHVAHVVRFVAGDHAIEVHVQPVSDLVHARLAGRLDLGGRNGAASSSATAPRIGKGRRSTASCSTTDLPAASRRCGCRPCRGLLLDERRFRRSVGKPIAPANYPPRVKADAKIDAKQDGSFITYGEPLFDFHIIQQFAKLYSNICFGG